MLKVIVATNGTTTTILESYISVDKDEYKEKICDASIDNGHDNNSAEQTLTNDDEVFVSDAESNETSNDAKKRKGKCTLPSKLKICVIAAVTVVFMSIVIYVIIPKSSEKDKVHSDDSVSAGSPFVSKLCPSDASHHECSDCNGKLLPNFCFCDIGQQCNNQDAPRKQRCSWCKDNCPCMQNGTCICDRTGEGLYCKCPEGYDGTYCENIPYRICKIDHETTELEHCKKSRNETCFINIQDIKLKCTISKKVDESIENCSSNNTEIMKYVFLSTKEQIVLPNKNGGKSFLLCFELIILSVFIEFCNSYVL
ncbi:unnamed protein product [Mytilus edulis]|uniref:EGF-like domain-containing protein n=1 Tax=Mytilus edulis TaxID=6550 RepID=A0A8S3RI19_MYTED|nr:unnamed protein product [Mytilus edulis]